MNRENAWLETNNLRIYSIASAQAEQTKFVAEKTETSDLRTLTAVGKGADWLTPGRFAALLALFILAAYPDVILGGQTFFFRDFGLFGYPLAHYVRESYWRGELPLWNPLNHAGVPFLAQWNTMALYPPILFYLLFPLSWALPVFCLAHQFLAGFGMYRLCARWVHHPLGAAAAGVAFAFNGLILNALMWPNNIAALGWLPWVILAVERAWIEGGRKRLILATLAGALQMLAGAPEIILFTWLILLVLGSSQLWRATIARRILLLRATLVVLGVGGLSAAQLLPFFDLLSHSQRHSDYAADYGSIPIWGWANLLVPAYRCFSRAGVWFQIGQYWTSSYYLGIGVLGLAILGAWQVPGRTVKAMSAIALASLVVAMGESGLVYSWLRKIIPPVGFINFPVKFIVYAIFLFPLLAAFGIRQIHLEAAPQRRLAARRALVVLALLLLTISLIVLYSRWRPAEDETWSRTFINGLTRALFLGLIFGVSVWSIQGRVGPAQRLVPLFLLTLMWLDVLTHAPRQNPTAPPDFFAPNLPRLQPKPIHGHSRAMLRPQAEHHLRAGTTEDPQKDFLFYRLGLFDNVNLLDRIPVIQGFYSLDLPLFQQVRRSFVIADLPPAPLADFLGVSHWTAPGELVRWEFRPSYLPLATAGQQPLFRDAPSTLRGLADPDFDPQAIVYLPLELASRVTISNAVTATVLSAEFQAQSAEIEIEASDRALLLIAQAYYHHWRAYLDGQRVPIWRANHAFQALPVPAGRHQVRLVYHDTAFAIGAAISIVSWLLLVAGLLWPQSWASH